MSDNFEEAMDSVANAIHQAFGEDGVIHDTIREAFTFNDFNDGENAASGLHELARAVMSAKRAILPDACGGPDASGGHVNSLTEAVMGVTAGLIEISRSIDFLASTVSEIADGMNPPTKKDPSQ